jgi:hypothetical protein
VIVVCSDDREFARQTCRQRWLVAVWYDSVLIFGSKTSTAWMTSFATKCAQSCTLLFAFPAEDLADRLGPEDVVAPGKMYSSDLPADSDEDPI